MDSNVVGTQLSAAIVTVWAMQSLKDAKWFPWLKDNGQVWIKRGISVAIALGIHTGVSHIWNPGNTFGAGTLTLVFPGWIVMVTGLWHWANQYIYQETGYQLLYNRPLTTQDTKGSIAAKVSPTGALVVGPPEEK